MKSWIKRRWTGLKVEIVIPVDIETSSLFANFNNIFQIIYQITALAFCHRGNSQNHKKEPNESYSSIVVEKHVFCFWDALYLFKIVPNFCWLGFNSTVVTFELTTNPLTQLPLYRCMYFQLHVVQRVSNKVHLRFSFYIGHSNLTAALDTD